MFWSCKHEWQVVSDVMMPSAAEQLFAAGITFKDGILSSFTKAHILTLSCKKCGKLHIEKTKNP